MTDRKMTKAEIAAQMGISPEALAQREAVTKAENAAARQRDVAARVQAEAPAAKPAEEPNSWDKLKGSLRSAYTAAANEVSTLVAPVKEAAAEFEDARKRNATPDSNENRRTERRMQQAGLDGP